MLEENVQDSQNEFEFDLKEFFRKLKENRLSLEAILTGVFSILTLGSYYLGNPIYIFFLHFLTIGFAVDVALYYFRNYKPYTTYIEEKLEDLRSNTNRAIRPGLAPLEFIGIEENLDLLSSQLQRTKEVRRSYQAELEATYEKIDYEISRINTLIGDYIALRKTIGDFQQTLNDTLNETAANISKFEELVSENSLRIGEFSTSLNSIAKQNKILSLNAEIEAVKVGELGKGFEVVASNVQKLAEQTKRLSEEISNVGGSLEVEGLGTSSMVIEEIETLTSTFQDIGKAIESFEKLIDSLNRSLQRLSQLRQSLSYVDIRA
ncbi:MAG: hypothetical protein D6732_29070 [Methanobacteriota archaeon]|nr:MAG: hypothetical protein D6732_29070 [Euryarchaeota archaeon]